MSFNDNNTYDPSLSARNMLNKLGIQALLEQDGVTEVAINGPGEMYAETSEGWKRYDAPQCDLDRLFKLANLLSVFQENKSLNLENPIQSVRLPSGERGQIVIPPVCTPGTVSITIRRPSNKRFTIDDYINSGRFDNIRDMSTFLTVPEGVALKPYELELLDAKNNRQMRRFFELAIEHELNQGLVGATGSGKTTATKALIDLIPPAVRLVTLEDTHELDTPLHPNTVHLFYGDHVTPKELVKSCMRMKPGRVLLTELRGDEAWDYLALLNTGHPGSITTVHANDCITAFHRIATLIKQSEVGITLDFNFILREVMTTIDLMMFFDRTRLTQIYYDPVKKYQLLNGAK